MDNTSEMQQQGCGCEVVEYARDERLVRVVNDVRLALRQSKRPRGETCYQDSGSEDNASSGDSADDDDLAQRQQSESVEDLRTELTRLEISEEASTLETLIIIVEHYVKTGHTDGFMKNIRRPDLWLQTLPRPKISDLIAMAENLLKQGLHFRAVMMYKALCALYKIEYVHYPSDDDPSDIIVPNDAVCGVEECMGKVFDIFNDIFDTSECKAYLVHFVAIMYDMLTNLREIYHAHRKYKADLEAWGMLYIAVIHGRLGEIVEMHDVAETNVKTLERRFKKKVQRHLVYGISLLALSLSEHVSGNTEEGEKCSKSALAALQDSKGMPTWDKKVELVAQAEEFVVTLRGHGVKPSK